MGAKVDAAISAIGGGVQAVIIAAGGDRDVIDDIMTGKVICVDRFLPSGCYRLPSPDQETRRQTDPQIKFLIIQVARQVPYSLEIRTATMKGRKMKLISLLP